MKWSSLKTYPCFASWVVILPLSPKVFFSLTYFWQKVEKSSHHQPSLFHLGLQISLFWIFLKKDFRCFSCWTQGIVLLSILFLNFFSFDILFLAWLLFKWGLLSCFRQKRYVIPSMFFFCRKADLPTTFIETCKNFSRSLLVLCFPNSIIIILKCNIEHRIQNYASIL